MNILENTNPNDDHKQPLPDTVEAWKEHVDKLERVMLEDKQTISLLRDRVNKLQATVDKLRHDLHNGANKGNKKGGNKRIKK